MSAQELNSYRFTSVLEPRDEMLGEIMMGVARDANMRRHARIVKAGTPGRIKATMDERFIYLAVI